MLNQVSNLTQWKNLTEEEQAGFDWSYEYERQHGHEWVDQSSGKAGECVYRLVIQPDKFYFYMDVGDAEEDDPFIKGIFTGKEINEFDPVEIAHLRPATEAELPEPKRVFKDGAFYPVRCNNTHHYVFQYDLELDRLGGINLNDHIITWIGEELKIEWGKS